jgi:hypothetical protein
LFAFLVGYYFRHATRPMKVQIRIQ